jgi:DNA repair exonuclease SbcCD ATPase subunit
MMMIPVPRVALLVVLALASTSVGNPCGAQPDARSLNDRNVLPFVISYDPDVLPLNSTIISSLLRNEQLHRRVRDKVDGFPAGLAFDLLVFPENEQVGRITGLLSIVSPVREEQPTAELDVHRLSAAVLEELENSLSSMAKQLSERKYEEYELLGQLLEEQEKEVERKLAEAQEEMGRSIQVVNVADEMRQLSSTKREVALQLAGIEARRQALQERIEELRNTSPAAELDREIIEQLEKIVENQQHQLTTLRELYRVAKVSRLEVSKAEAELAKAAIDLLRAKKDATAKASPELTGIAEALSQATITAAEQRAMLQAIESRFKELRNSLADQSKRMRAEQEAERRGAVLRDQLATIEKRRADLELEQLERMAARGGTVTIVPWSEPPEED